MLDEAPAGATDWIAAELNEIGAQAAAAGAVSAAQTAGRLAAGAAAPGGIGAAELTAGIASLQAALISTSPAPSPLAEDPELIADFVFEAGEHLTSIEAQMLILEKEPGNTGALHSAFRSFHTIKGVAGFLELPHIQSVAHEVETLLDRARNRMLVITPDLVDVLLTSADFIRTCTRLLEKRLQGNAAPLPEPDIVLSNLQQAMERRPIVMPEEARDEPPAPKTTVAERAGGAVKIDTAKLDYLVDMVGEMVIAQSLVRHDPALAEVRNARLARNLAQLSRMTGEVQRTAMAMRMVPISQLFRRVARQIRDLSRKSGKQVQLRTSGEETELDRTIVEDLADPLLHMVRNAVDHGIESPQCRQAAGKPAAGTVALKASHQAGNIVIEIADDGRGLDREKILKKAMERGLVDRRRELSEAEILQLIFQPGFSTADTVTDVSGRGVGMDVVRRRLEQMRGRLEMQSTPGQGSRFVIRLPLTLAIIDGLVVGVGTERYIVPIFAVRETLRPAADTISTIENTAEVALVRQQLLPVLRLARCFNVVPKSENACEGVLIVSETEGRTFGLLVDELIGKQEVVIKSLGQHIGQVPGVAGGAILGDGRVGLIVDLQSMYRSAHDAERL
jgi:two-component system chemotaxis sensor kinase CheA